MITVITIPVLLLIISFSAYAGMGTLQFHYYQSKFIYLQNPQFWNPIVSCNNKYKNGIKSQGEAFWFSTTLFVFVTDGYHLLQFVYENALFLGISLYNTNYKWYWGFVGIRILYGIVFNPMFNKILIIKK